MNSARFLKYVCSFFSIKHKRINFAIINPKLNINAIINSELIRERINCLVRKRCFLKCNMFHNYLKPIRFLKVVILLEKTCKKLHENTT